MGLVWESGARIKELEAALEDARHALRRKSEEHNSLWDTNTNQRKEIAALKEQVENLKPCTKHGHYIQLWGCDHFTPVPDPCQCKEIDKLKKEVAWLKVYTQRQQYNAYGSSAFLQQMYGQYPPF